MNLRSYFILNMKVILSNNLIGNSKKKLNKTKKVNIWKIKTSPQQVKIIVNPDSFIDSKLLLEIEVSI